jgi:uncharacterized protein YqjF (DUF2071 family)
VILETALADALYLNWAIPEPSLPPLPKTLAYDTTLDGEASSGFFTLVLFRQVGLHLRSASWLSLSYPQANARLYVRDAVGTPSVFLSRQLAPAWVVPIARTVARQPVSAALLDYPRAGVESVDGARRWRGQAGRAFEVVAKPGAPACGAPRLGDWNATAAFFRERGRAYWQQGGVLRRVETEHPAADVVPMAVEIVVDDWLDTFLPFAPAGSWRELHSAFLVPEVRLAFATGRSHETTAVAPAAAPAAAGQAAAS